MFGDDDDDDVGVVAALKLLIIFTLLLVGTGVARNLYSLLAAVSFTGFLGLIKLGKGEQGADTEVDAHNFPATV